ncbi:ATP5 [Candida oxycetoniae]|uniref:ATP synthase subunit 5, mitochondrial n=1 Tax=Candida oxycetoniae TaxID=497107 RepID=A0AAI9ST40_9ASCO|nr:ATP5 [Candida oxycetoniae]KAI3402567.1 ATP5 [Candida oxycetoniae]
MISRVFARRFALTARRAAAAPVSGKDIRPPIELFGIDGTYANSLYSATLQESDIGQTYSALKKVEKVLSGDPKLEHALTNPGLSKEDRIGIIKSVNNSLNLDKTTANFLLVLAENNRLSIFPSIFKKFGMLNDAHNGIVNAKVISTKPLDGKILRKLQASIGNSSFVGQGKTLKLNNEVDPSIKGGLIVEVGDRTVDVSIADKVNKLNQALKENV